MLTDIGNEPDDAQSLIRLLLYANEFEIEGLVATTSNWQKTIVSPEKIRVRVEAYDKVRDNLLRHAEGYPEGVSLLKVIKAGRAEFGMDGVGEGKNTEASKWIIQVVDRADPRPVWITVWGGAVDLAQALWTVSQTRGPEEVRTFIDKIRVYTISDQDDAGGWMRRTFPTLFYISSVHAYSNYGNATWCGISGDRFYSFRGADFSLVSNAWLDEHVRMGHGPMGELYPRTEYIMEGDTPSFLYLIPNGLNFPERPEWGGWGGRYDREYPGAGHYDDTIDTVVGADGLLYTDNRASIWRWREAYQHDFAARMDWTVSHSRGDANHNPVPILNGRSGLDPVTMTVQSGEKVELSAAGSEDPDGDRLDYQWFQYREASGRNAPEVLLEGAGTAQASFVAPRVRNANEIHIILSVTDDGDPRLYSYRRTVITIQPE